jgi:hypothetical protein
MNLWNRLGNLIFPSLRINGYWEGRLKGWQACESLTIAKAKERGMKKEILELLQ